MTTAAAEMLLLNEALAFSISIPIYLLQLFFFSPPLSFYYLSPFLDPVPMMILAVAAFCYCFGCSCVVRKFSPPVYIDAAA